MTNKSKMVEPNNIPRINLNKIPNTADNKSNYIIGAASAIIGGLTATLFTPSPDNQTNNNEPNNTNNTNDPYLKNNQSLDTDSKNQSPNDQKTLDTLLTKTPIIKNNSNDQNLPDNNSPNHLE